MMSSLAPGSDVTRFGDIIERRLGLFFDDSKRDFLIEVLDKCLAQSGTSSGNAYLQRLEKDDSSAEWRLLGQLLTVPETYFFRHFDQFRAFTEVALPDRMRVQAAGRRLNILSLGCASGEETYSLAIMARETVADAAWNVSILGADINPAIIDKAIAGCYTDWALRETPSDFRQKWFRQQGRNYLLDPDIRAAVRFERRNLAADDPDFWRAGAYDVIFCRNMMMYFSAESARALVGRISRCLAPGGYLFLGHAETLRGLTHDFHLSHTHETFYYRRRGSDEAVAFSPPASAVTVTLPAPLTAVLDNGNAWIEAIQLSTERISALAETSAGVESGENSQRHPAQHLAAGEAPRWDLKNAFELLQQERFTEALSAVRELPSAAENDADILLLKAVLYAHGGQLAEAEQVCRTLLELDELNAGARYVLALCREGSGEHQAAVDHDQAAVYLDPGFAMPRLHLGLLARRAGDREAARHELKQALTLLQREDPSRLLLFGGGFGREALLALCRAEYAACGGHP